MTGIVTAYENASIAGQLVADAVRSAEGVQKDLIDVLLMEFTENQMLWKVGWWLASIRYVCCATATGPFRV
jgi:hypothetical protein